jgi:UDP-glucose-4-epimerase GalE
VNNGGEMATDTETMSQSQNISSIHKSVLIVGGAGYIGSHTAKQLKKNGFTPVVVDRDIRSKPWATQYGPAFEINLPRDVDLLDELIKRFNIDSCIHFAAYTKVGESVADPSKYYLNNVVMTLRLIDKLRSLGVNKFVFSSSAATYGIPENGVANIDAIPQPINPYGKTKYFVEEILKDYYTAYGLSSVSLRYFNAAGADAEAEIGELREDETHIVPLAIEAAKQNKEFKLFGTDFDTPDGTCVRDYVHVTDLAQGHVLSLIKASDNTICERYNLGSGIGVSNLELLHTIQKYAGDMNIIKMDRRAGDPPTLVADIDRTLAELNWKPEHSAIDNIVRTAVQWYNKMHPEKIN